MLVLKLFSDLYLMADNAFIFYLNLSETYYVNGAQVALVQHLFLEVFVTIVKKTWNLRIRHQ